jgi:hypothetical protein
MAAAARRWVWREQQRGRERRRAGVQADMQADAQKRAGDAADFKRDPTGPFPGRWLAFSRQPPSARGPSQPDMHSVRVGAKLRLARAQGPLGR